MIGINNNIKLRLLFFTGTIVFLFGLFFIFSYNDFFFARKTLEFHNRINILNTEPSQLALLHNSFVKNDILNERFYFTEKSKSLDSMLFTLGLFQKQLDSLNNLQYFLPQNVTRIQIKGLISHCKKLCDTYSILKQQIIKRGYLKTGEAGEVDRFINYLVEFASAESNPTLMKSMVEINKIQSDYQSAKTNDQIQLLFDRVDALKVLLSMSDMNLCKGMPETNRLKLIKELETFAVLIRELQKTDLKIGFSGGQGTIAEAQLQLEIIKDKSQAIYQEIKTEVDQKIFIQFIIKTSLLIFLLLLYLWFLLRFSKIVTSAIEEIKNFASELVLGKLPNPLNLTASSELIAISILSNNFAASLREKIRFATNLGSGKTNATMLPLSEDDKLANALLDMEKSLKKASEEDQKYKIEEQKRAWTNEGLAKFGEILRMQTDNLATLSDAIITNLVKYLNANQGCIFLYNDEDKSDIHLQLISAFAFDRKKYLNKRIELGEGLIGTCALEKQTIMVTEVPEGYMEITSGLGEAPPRSILIVPLRSEEVIFGIVEIASFNFFEPHEIDFVERIAQSTASTFATVKININTSRLLEQSKKQAEEMAQQEEELRQNLEELQSTQEESERREAEINSLLVAVDASALVIQTDMEGRITEVNKKFSSIVKKQRDELIGAYLRNIFIFNVEIDEYYNLLHELKQGKLINRNEILEFDDGSKVYLVLNYSPILDREGKPYKVLGIATNITDKIVLENSISTKEREVSEMEYHLTHFNKLIDSGFIRCELSSECILISVNENYTETTGYTLNESVGKDYRKFLKPDELKQFELIWAEVLKDKSYKAVIKRTMPAGDEHWLMTSFIPFKNKMGEITKIIFVAQDITEKKLKYQVLEEANKEIERLKGMKNQS